MKKVEEFIDSIKIPNTAKVVVHVFKDVDVKIETLTKDKLTKYIQKMQPNSPKAITTICYVFGLYAKWLIEQGDSNGEHLLKNAQEIDKKNIWAKVKKTAKKKYISYSQYEKAIKSIRLYEEFNGLYYECLFGCVYEGVYNDDMSVLKNLRASDIDDNILTLHEDNGHYYKLKISRELAKKLKVLAQIKEWERRNRYGICRVNMRGLYKDSVFKVEDRKTGTDASFRFSYYAKLRKISREHLEYSMLPFQIYISGMTFRIKKMLEKYSISLEEAFKEHSRNEIVHEIIKKELIRCNYGVDVGNFREMVKGHTDAF